MRWVPALVLAGSVWIAADGHASDTINRCAAPDGTTVYTDKPCADLGARAIVPPPPVARGVEMLDGERRAPGSTSTQGGAVSLGGASRSDCIRRTDTLLFELRSAIEAQNVNRLAGIYDWAGKSSRAAGGIIERLSRIASRPLASVEFRYPEPDLYADVAALDEPPKPAPRPVGVVIEQMAPGDISPTFREELGLVRNADCWWISF